MHTPTNRNVELKNIEQPVVELTPEAADAAKGGHKDELELMSVQGRLGNFEIQRLRG
jgi:hypothetical protein